MRERVGLPITVGVAGTKFLAKVASGVAKPDGLLVVAPGDELRFLGPLPVERLWGVGRVTAKRLRARGVETAGQVARLDAEALASIVGQAAARHLHALARNRDPRRVRRRVRRRSMGTQRALGRSRRSLDDLDPVLVGLVDRLARRLRAARRVCRTVTLRLRVGDVSRATRSQTGAEATAETAALLAAARALLAAAMPMIEARGITLLGVAVGNLEDAAAIQLALPLDLGRRTGLDAALDDIRQRFGSAAIRRAVLVGRDLGPSVPLLPD